LSTGPVPPPQTGQDRIMGVPKRLTEMQMRFCEMLVYNEGRTTGHQACIDAGYSKDNARPMASRLQNPRYFPLVVKYLGELREERLRRFEVTYERHITELAKIRDAALKRGSFSAAANAENMRGKAAGLYIEQKIIKTGKLEDMSEGELEAKMKQILEDYAPILKAKQIEGEVEEQPPSPTKEVKALEPPEKVEATDSSAT